MRGFINDTEGTRYYGTRMRGEMETNMVVKSEDRLTDKKNILVQVREV